MAYDYTRYIGSKERIGWIESTNDNSKFVIESATVTIIRNYFHTSTGSMQREEVIKGAPCNVDNKDESTHHQVDYIWEIKGVGADECQANFSLHLKGGLVLVRQVLIKVCK